MSFGSDLERFAARLERRTRDVAEGAADEVHDSIVEGSAVTGSPGQPVETGELRDSWTNEEVEPDVWHVATDKFYAAPVEHGHPTHRRSVALTRAGWHEIVRTVLARLGR
ncbi:MAG: HK97 gp10 family phage protein [Gemmatimonadota bacterium]|nr:HK97 gp10 family phage protein [Gemmatimonadota bacterium]